MKAARLGGWFWQVVEYLTPFRRHVRNGTAFPVEVEELEPSPGKEVLIELVGLHARALKRIPIAQALVVMGLGMVAYPHVQWFVFVGWGCLTLAIEGLRATYAETVLRRCNHIEPGPVHSRFVALAALAGCCVGLGGVLSMPALPIIDQALLTIVMFAMPAAGITVAVSSKHILAIYALGILSLTAFTWISIHPEHEVTVGLLTTLYWGFLVIVAADGEKLLLKSVLLRYQRDRMVVELEHSNAEVRTAVERAEQNAQARDRVLAAASHDLRQPLHALSVYSAILAANPACENLPEISQNIERIVGSLGGLLNGLLDLSSLSAGEYQPDQQIFSLDKIVQDVCAEYESAVAEKKLFLQRDLAPVRMNGDAVAVARIIRNLLDNAIKYTDTGWVRIETRSEGYKAILAIADTGIGIPQPEQSRVFEEFYQLNNPGRDRGKGVGLGLAIVKRLCDLNRAQLSLSSTLGMGTCWELVFPSAVTIAPESEPEVEKPEPSSLQGLRVYVVDDESDILDSMGMLLSHWNVSVKTAGSASQLEALFDLYGKPDLLIADLRLGGTEPGDALAMRLQQVFGPFQAWFITGETVPAGLQASLMQKPLAPGDLYARLQELAATLTL